MVAEEVRKLAEQSEAVAKKIAAMIGEIQEDTVRAVAAMQNGTREVKTGTKVVNNAGQAFGEIASFVEKVSEQVSEIALAIEKIAVNSGHVVASMREIDRVSKHTTAETQTISAATEEQSASMEEMAASSQRLAQMALDWKALLNNLRYKQKSCPITQLFCSIIWNGFFLFKLSFPMHNLRASLFAYTLEVLLLVADITCRFRQSALFGLTG
ncbi:hypothetical protein AXX12_15090 [Anaerosporomusa subterranea]|uniref:Methyl-accepting transducer domain-containing protein n=1 Tax=Anaerosporomusa subterranea TaxID=1794912 RepID=A0A154BLW8_ANASB|nr:methyl-accepting chemotaxis protein [Anaerosporomusa subterranea]KYZ74905.1 hypothetical protein AXX12_15090 [Anaerosporomusa subterranea]